MNIDATMDYLDFVVGRHQVWDSRQLGYPQPWTEDPILRERKFTNVFRVLDYGSQFFLQELATVSPRDVLARSILYRHTNRPETWLELRRVLGRYPLADDFNETTADVLCFLRDEGMQVFNGAYMILAERQTKGVDKSRGVVLASRQIINDAWPAFEKATSISERYRAIREPKGMGDFLAMQVLTDYGYAFGPDEENDFIIPGPGAIKGAKFLSPTRKPIDMIKWAHKEMAQLPISVTLPDGRKRAPSLMDAQNTLCEFSKYVRYQSKPATGKPYTPAHPGPQPAPVLPSHW